MAYIGNSPANVGNYQIIDDIKSQFDGTKTSFQLQVSAHNITPAKSGQLLVSINGVLQEPDDTGLQGFTISGTNIVFSSAPNAGAEFWGVYQGQNVDIGTPSFDTVDTVHIKDDAITDAKLNSTKLDGIDNNANNYSHPTSHTVSEVTGLQSAIDGKLSLTGGSLSSSLNVTGSVTATSFSGDGSALTNLPAAGATSLDGLTDATYDGMSLGIGDNALLNDDGTSNGNTAIGTAAMYFNTTGGSNTASGLGALQNNTTGSYNTASGALALLANTTSSYNTASGVYAMVMASGSNNVALGYQAGMQMGSGSGNVVLGYQAGIYESGSNKLHIANNQAESLIEGDFSAKTLTVNGALTATSFSGDGSALTNLPASGATNLDGLTDAVNDGSSVAIGTNALSNDDGTSNSNTAVGTNALNKNTTGSRNTASGYDALKANTTGYYNTASGMEALYSNTSGYQNTASGMRALNKNTSGYQNTASGTEALWKNTTGYQNTASGAYTMRLNTTGSENVASGMYALYANTTGTGNTATGKDAMYTNTTGSYNTAIGREALKANTTGSYNATIGNGVMRTNTIGAYNTAVGQNAMTSNTTGSFNTTIGRSSMQVNTTGTKNTVVGYEAMYSNSTGTSNVALGYGAGYSETGSNKLHIANNSTESLIEGDFSAKTLTVNGALTATSFSGDGSALTGIDALPTQTGHTGKYLGTNGTTATWNTLDTDANSTTKGLYEHANTISANYSITSGNNAMTAGPITINTGVSVTIPTGSTWVIT